MFIGNYLNDTYLDMLYDTYDENYINNLNENNFQEVYKLLKDNGIYCMEDIILKYLEVFTIEPKYVSLALENMKNELGNNYPLLIARRMTLMQRVIDKAYDYLNAEEK